MDKDGIDEIAEGFKSSDQAVANDCVKVLYEIGQRNPKLIADYTGDFITALSCKNNRLIWGSMKALAFTAPIKPETIYSRLPEILAAYQKGSVITVDNCISVLAHLCKAGVGYSKKILLVLLDHLAKCRAKEIPQHAERMAVCIDSGSKVAFVSVLLSRAGELTEAQYKRVKRLIGII